MIEMKVREDIFDKSKYNFIPSEDGESWMIGTGNDTFAPWNLANAFKNGTSDCPENLTIPTHFTDDLGVAKPVEIIGTYAFYNCDKTKWVKVTKQVKVIKPFGLGFLTKVEHFEVEEGSMLEIIETSALQSIGDFRDNKEIKTTFVIPQTVYSVEANAIQRCSLFEEIIYCGTTILTNKSVLTDIKVRTKTSYNSNHCLGQPAVKNNMGETNDICNKLDYPPVFSYSKVDGGFEVTGWKNVSGSWCPPDLEIPEILYGRSVVSIKNNAFENCETAGPILLPSSLKRVGTSAFAKMSNVTAVNSSASDLVVEENAFMGCGINAEQPINVSVHQQTKLGKSAFNEAKVGEVYVM